MQLSQTSTHSPTEGQQVNDSGTTSAAGAFLESKLSRHAKSQYNHNNTNLRPVDRCANDVILYYDQKFKKLDCRFAADVVGDGSNDIMGPFEADKKRFFRGQVIPVCAG